MSRGAWTLRTYPLDLIRISCAKCARSGQYHIRGNGEKLDEVGRRRQKQQLITLVFELVHMRPDGIADRC